MKTVILVRHAKSSWAEQGVSDFDRQLNERGKRDAPEMAKRLLKKISSIDLFISSPAKRAKKTAQLFAEVYSYQNDATLFAPELYMASVAVFYAVIKKIPSENNTVIIFSHNNGITDFANSLTTVKIDNMPTASIFAVLADCSSWAGFSESAKNFLFFDYPKGIDINGSI